MEGFDRRIKRIIFKAAAAGTAVLATAAYLIVDEPAFTCKGSYPDYHAARVKKGLLGETSVILQFDIAGKQGSTPQNEFSMTAANSFYEDAKSKAQNFCDGAMVFTLDKAEMSINSK